MDVTQEILNLGCTGRNMNSTNPSNHGHAGNKAPNRLGLPGGQIGASACADPSPNAMIRLARVRDNPSTATT